MYLKTTVFTAALFFALSGMAQDTRADQRAKTNELHKSRSAVERFDHSLLDTETKKERKRMEQEQRREQLLVYLDTLPISKSLKRNLLSDLDNNPFSGRFRKFLARYKKDMDALKRTPAVAQQK